MEARAAPLAAKEVAQLSFSTRRCSEAACPMATMATMATIACILYTEDIAEARWVVVVEHEVPEPELAHLLQPLELVLMIV